MSSSDEVCFIMPSDEDLKKRSEIKKEKVSEKKAEEKKGKLSAIPVSKKEDEFRKENFAEINVENLKLLCTSCGKQLFITSHTTIASHPILEVLLCKGCADFYTGGDFSVDEDGTDKYCRWCGQGGTLYLCSDCYFGFCRKCIKRNLQRSVLKDVLSDDWLCFSCNSKPLWELRGICAATQKLIQKQKESKRKYSGKLSRKAKYSSSESEDEKERRHKRKRRRSGSGSSSDRKNKRKRAKREDKDTTSSEATSHEKKKALQEYSKKKDREIVLSKSLSEKLIQEYEELSKDFFQILSAVSAEAKTLLKKRKLSADQVQNFPERYEIVKKIIGLRDLSVKSISQACENFVLAYQNVIKVSMKKDFEKEMRGVRESKKKKDDDSDKEGMKAENNWEKDDTAEEDACEDTENKKKREGSTGGKSKDNEDDVGEDEERSKSKVKSEEESKSSEKMSCSDEDDIVKKLVTSVQKQSKSNSAECEDKQSSDNEKNGHDDESNSGAVPNDELASSDTTYFSLNSPANSPDCASENTSSATSRKKGPKKLNVRDREEEEEQGSKGVSKSRAASQKVIEESASEGSDDAEENKQSPPSKSKPASKENKNESMSDNSNSPSGAASESVPLKDKSCSRQKKNGDKCGGVSSDGEGNSDEELASEKEDNSKEKLLSDSVDEECKENEDLSENPSSPGKATSESVPLNDKSLFINEKETDSTEELSVSGKYGEKHESSREKLNSTGMNEVCEDKNLVNKKKKVSPSVENDSRDMKNEKHAKKTENSAKKVVQNSKCDKKDGSSEYDATEKKMIQEILMSSSEAEDEDDDSDNKLTTPMSDSDDSSSKKRNSKKEVAPLSDSECEDSVSKAEIVVQDDTDLNCDDDSRVKDCRVVVKKLQKDSELKSNKSDTAEESGRSEVSEKTLIDRLTNLKTLEKVKSKKGSKSSGSDHDEENKSPDEENKSPDEVASSKKDKKKPVKKEKETLEDFLNVDSDGGTDNSNEDSSNEIDTKHTFSLKSILENLNKKSNKLAEEMLLKTSSSDADSDGDERDKKQNKEAKGKKTKVKKENGDKEEETEKEDKEEKVKKKEKQEDSVDSDDSDIFVRKKAAWRNEKLLRMKLSESDSSDDERRWKARKQKDKKESDESKKKRQRRLMNSDSDVAIITSDSSDSDSEELFKSTSKRKRKVGSVSDKSKSEKSSSDSDKSQKKKKTKRRRIRNPVTDSSDSERGTKEHDNSQKSTPGQGRKNIRRVLKDDNVGAATKRAAEEEEERRKRMAEKQKLYNEIFNISIKECEVADKLVLDFNTDTKEELLKVDETLVKKLKPHQVKGIKFMWDACFESLEQLEKTDGSGCILAHCMGLGKTLQVIALVHSLLTNEQTKKIKTVMVVCPLSTVLNWVHEFSKWLDELEDNDIEVFELTKYKQMYERVGVLSHWHKSGGVMIIGYQAYRTLCSGKGKKKRSIEAIRRALVDPGPDLVVCDEGHLLKNEGSALSKAMNQLKTRRRIVLTGTPLQNNLLEYHCMVQFVKPNLLGTKKEFSNRFVNPINNGQYENSTAHDVKVMKRRAHVLHKMLDSSVQRYDYSVLTPFLPPKFEYALSIRLTELQVKLYRHYLENIATPYGEDGVKSRTATLFKDYQALSKIWTHPRVLLMNSEKVGLKRLMASDSEGSLRDFIASDSNSDKSDTRSSSSPSSDSDIQEVSGDDKEKSSKKPARKPRTRNRADESGKSESEKEGEETEFKNPEDWWRQFISDESVFDDIRESGKLSLLFTLLAECDKIGDKVLVFSQSLFSLDLIEYFLAQMDEANQKDETKETLLGFKASWSIGLDYFRLDGSSSAENRQAWCKAFNREENLRARLFLISTRAGGLGINLFAANRVVIFDASWNPSYDLQSIFRVYRFGQKKPCYIYRFLAQATMEEKIYNRQVTKLSLACRVVDEQQIERHYSMSALRELYIYNPEEKSSTDTPLVPKDILLAELVRQEDSWIVTHHEHDTLLENKEEEELNEDERKAAWEDYEKEKKGLRTFVNQWDDRAFLNYLSGYGLSEHSIRENIMKQNPTFSEAEIQTQFSVVVRQLYDYVSSEAYNQKLQMQQNYQRQQQLQMQQQQQQPVYFQNPTMQPHAQMYGQDVRYTPEQRILPKPTTTSTSVASVNNLDRLMVQQKENSKLLMDHVPSTSSNSVNASQKPTIKVKSFGQINNSNFGSPKLTNPFASNYPSPVGHKGKQS